MDYKEFSEKGVFPSFPLPQWTRKKKNLGGTNSHAHAHALTHIHVCTQRKRENRSGDKHYSAFKKKKILSFVTQEHYAKLKKKNKAKRDKIT